MSDPTTTDSRPAEPTLSGAPAEQPTADAETGAPTGRRYGKRQPPVVATGERRPVRVPDDEDAYGRKDSDDPEPDFVGARPADEVLVDVEVAEHHHTGGTGHEFTPAGAHRHTGWDQPHDHPRLPPRATPPVVFPDPAHFDRSRSGEYDPAAQWTVDHDCKASIDGHMIDFKAGQVVSGSVGRFLADTGAPVTAK